MCSKSLLRLIKCQYISVRTLTRLNQVKHIVNKKQYRDENNLIYYEDPNAFGTLSRQRSNVQEVPLDEDDIKEDNYLKYQPVPSQKLTTRQYADLIKQYLKHKRLKQAIEVLEKKMLIDDNVKPENYIYNILIGACADVGYTKKAFSLYNDMKRRALKVTGDTYTCLFNACANSPWARTDGLSRAKHLRELMCEKKIEPNLTNYNAMIKAFGRCGDLSTAFKLVDEMKSKGIKIRVHTLNFLLQACITDEKKGLKHALIVWRIMLKLREKPNIFSFNLMLKCVKECNIGDKEDLSELMHIINQHVLLESKSDVKPLEDKLVIESKSSDKLLLDKIISSELAETQFNKTKIEKIHELSQEALISSSCSKSLITIPKSDDGIGPNLLSKVPQLTQVLGLQVVSSLQDKFAVIGGTTEFLKEMDKYSVKPDIKTFTQILPLLEDNDQAETMLLEYLKKYDVKADIDFYNMLIKKRCLRNDYDGAFAVRDIILKENKERKKKHFMKKKLILKCNVMTYGVLAMACKTKEEAQTLIQEMNDKQLKLNSEILGTLLRQGTAHSNFGYILYILKLIKDENLPINNVFLKHLEHFNEKCNNLIGLGDGVQKCTEVFVKSYSVFEKVYNKWLKEVKLDKALTKQHPWKQFQDDIPEPYQRDIQIVVPKRFYKRNRKFVKPYTV